MTEPYEPETSFEFIDFNTNKPLLLCLDASSIWYGWLFYRNVDNQWVSLRKATRKDLNAIFNMPRYVRLEI